MASHRAGLVPVVALLLTGCGSSGSGRVETATRQISGVTAVQLTGAGELTIEQTGSESLTIEADADVLPKLTSDVVDGTLVLGTRGSISSSRPIKYSLTVASLDGIEVTGSGTVRMSSVETDHLAVSISGSGDIDLAGRAESQVVKISGSGRYQAGDLESTTAEVHISGSGAAVVQVQDTLDVTVAGSGSVTYLGHPTVTQDVSGSGQVTQG